MSMIKKYIIIFLFLALSPFPVSAAPVSSESEETVLMPCTESVEIIKKEIAETPGVYYNHMVLAGVYMELGTSEAAFGEFDRALRLAPESYTAHYFFARACLHSGNYAKAVELFEKSLKYATDEVEARFGLAVTYLNLKDVISAAGQCARLDAMDTEAAKFSGHFINIYRPGISDSENSENYFSLGMNYKNSAEFEYAAECFRQALRFNGSNADCWRELGSCLLSMENHFEALRPLKKAIELNKNDSAAMYSLGVLYYGVGNIDMAVKYLKDAVSLNPSDYQAQYNLGVAYNDCGVHEAAIECYKAALKANPDYLQACYNLGVTYFTYLKRTGEALPYLKRAAELDPQWADAHFLLGAACHAAGEKDRAKAEYEILKKIDAGKSLELMKIIEK